MQARAPAPELPKGPGQDVCDECYKFENVSKYCPNCPSYPLVVLKEVEFGGGKDPFYLVSEFVHVFAAIRLQNYIIESIFFPFCITLLSNHLLMGFQLTTQLCELFSHFLLHVWLVGYSPAVGVLS